MSELDINKAVGVTATFLRRRGYDVLDVLDGNETVKIVARDPETGETVFISVQLRERGVSDAEPAGSLSAEYEAEACEWLAGHETLDDCRFDAVTLTIVDDSRAFLRHQVDCLGAF